jgi:hypothetical protein
MSLLDGGIATIVGNALSSIMLDGTLQRTVATTADAYGDPVESSVTSYAIKAFDEEYTAAYRAVAGIPETDSKVNILASLLAVEPQPDDVIVFRGRTLRVRAVMSDPARALWTCQVFEVSAT